MTTQNPLVSILTICYNGTPWLKAHLESILAQTYEPIEYILVNNGSTDSMDEMVASYQPRLEAKLAKFVYVHVEKNEGVTGGMDTGLKYIQGKYFTWPNADDILYPDSIEKRVAFMEKNPQYGLCYAEVDTVFEDDLNTIVGLLKRTPPTGADTLFQDLILEKNVFFTSIGTFARTECFDKVNPTRFMPHNEAGENYQMLLPLSYAYPCGYLNDKSGKYVIRRHSASHGIDEMVFYRRVKELLQNTLNRMDISQQEKAFWQGVVKRKYCKQKLKVYVKKCLKFFHINYNLIKKLYSK